MESYLNLSLPFGLAPTEATIGSYRQKPSARALHRVYSVEATFGSEKRCFHRYETGGEQWPVSAASSHQLSPHWHKASGSESKKKMLHSVAEYGARGARSKDVGKAQASSLCYGHISCCRSPYMPCCCCAAPRIIIWATIAIKFTTMPTPSEIQHQSFALLELLRAPS